MFLLCSCQPNGGLWTTICLSEFEQWDATGARVETVLAASADLKLGKAAFAEAVRQRPNERIILRHKTRVICDHGSEQPTTN